MVSETGEAEKQRNPISSPPMPSKHFSIYLHFDTFGDSHGFYYVIEEKGDSPAPQYRRPRVETSDSEEDSEYPLPKLKLNRGKEVDVEDEDDEEDYVDPLKEAEKEAIAEALFYGATTYIPCFGPYGPEIEKEGKGEALYYGVGSDSDSDYYYYSDEESSRKKSKLEQVEAQNREIRVENYSKETKEGEILVIFNGEADTIRPLQFPDLPYVPFTSDLLLIGGRFYFIGGYNVPKSECGHYGHFPPMTNMLVWDSDVDKVWKLLPGPDVLSYNEHHPPRKAAACAAGTIIVTGHTFKKMNPTVRGLSSGDTARKILPLVPASYITCIGDISPLAVNGSKIFFQVNGNHFVAKRKYSRRPVHLAAYFDVKSWQWEMVGMWFTGVWSPGVVLYDAYLFSYGRTKDFLQKYICVYSIERQCWLRRPVRGLKRDGNVLPKDNENIIGVAAYLFQVEDNVLAFVWSRQPEIRLKEEKVLSDVHCTKFVLHCIRDPRKKHPVFRAEVISYGRWLVEGYELQNCLVKRQSVTT